MKLYKFFPNERVDFVHHRLVRLTPPTAFNDPFDMLPVVESVFRTKRATNAAKPRPGTLGSVLSDIHALGERMADSLFNRRGLLQEYLSITYGILCLSERYDSLLMWAHYASDHKGFVVEFDASHAWFNQGTANPGEVGVGVVRKITYSDERPTVSLQSNPIDNYFAKGAEWSYEGEWRLVLRLDKATKTLSTPTSHVQLFEVPHTAISSIILGARISVADRKTLMQCRGLPAFAHVRLVQASLSPRRFGLDFSPIPTQQACTTGEGAHKSRKRRPR
jgi:hypothetical protein